MNTNSLAYGIIGFLLGGLLVSIAATTFDKPSSKTVNAKEMTMSQMNSSLAGKQGDAYDEAFVAYMIDHHQAAVDMAKQSASRAKHAKVKQLSENIVKAQEKEISEMKQWQKDWGYDTSSSTMNTME